MGESKNKNKPCPCKSKKLYKDCCGVKKSPDVFKLAQETAYLGDMGAKRLAFCSKQGALLQEHHEAVMEKLETSVHADKKKISCKKGCHHCCYQFIGGTIQEFDTIVNYLYKNESILKSFLINYPKWREKIREHQDLFDSMNKAATEYSSSIATDVNSKERFLQLGREYQKIGAACPFLSEGACSIYPVRPTVCASVVSTSDPEYCKAASPIEPDIYMHDMTDQYRVPYFYGEDNFLFSCMPLAVYEILKGGYFYLNALPGLDGIEEDYITGLKGNGQ
jgi:Fe-S-cluster containining protein